MIFHYRVSGSLLSRCNPLIKLGSLITLCILLQQATLTATVFFSLCIAALMLQAKMPIRRLIPELMFFLILTAIIFLSVYLPHKELQKSMEKSASFLVAVLGSLLFADTTDPSDLARSLGSFLHRLHFKDGWKFANQVELTLTCIPLIYDTYAHVRDARRARLAYMGKHPIRSIYMFSKELMEQLLDQIDEMAYAMDARSFDENKPRASLPYGWADLMLVCGMVISAIFGRMLPC
jgi:energy-coupling factor transporter transmembrane protein EcfT